MDLLFPHHEAEIAQSKACTGKAPVRYWLHNNMITIDGQKMGKSLGNFINLEEFFQGTHARLTQAYSPMTIRYFMLTAHYRSTLDFSNESLGGAEKALQRVLHAQKVLHTLKPGEKGGVDVAAIRVRIIEALSDDLNTAIALSHLFELVRAILAAEAGQVTFSAEEIREAKEVFSDLVEGVLGLKGDVDGQNESETLQVLMDLIIRMRADARVKKDWAASDLIRDTLVNAGIQLKDGPEGTQWMKSL
jgi:cysteinyl-tRNA synthetase